MGHKPKFKLTHSRRDGAVIRPPNEWFEPPKKIAAPRGRDLQIVACPKIIQLLRPPAF